MIALHLVKTAPNFLYSSILLAKPSRPSVIFSWELKVKGIAPTSTYIPTKITKFFKIKSKPKPNQQVVISALTDSLTGQIESMTSYDPNQSAFIQVGAFKKENVSEIVAADISKKLGARVEVRPTLVSDPVMYRILVGPEHKDQIINVIADLMDLGISDYFLTRG